MSASRARERIVPGDEHASPSIAIKSRLGRLGNVICAHLKRPPARLPRSLQRNGTPAKLIGIQVVQRGRVAFVIEATLIRMSPAPLRPDCRWSVNRTSSHFPIQCSRSGKWRDKIPGLRGDELCRNRCFVWQFSGPGNFGISNGMVRSEFSG